MVSKNQRMILRRLSQWPGRAAFHRQFLSLAIITPRMLDTLALMERRSWIRMVGDYVEITEAGEYVRYLDELAYQRYSPWASGLSGKATKKSPKTFDSY